MINPSFDLASLMGHNIEEAIAAGERDRKIQEEFYSANAVPVDLIGNREGPVHAASLQIWNAIASLVDVPTVEASLIASIPTDLLDDDLFCWNAVKPLDPVRHAPIIAAVEYAEGGGYWRTDICAPSSVKWQLSETGHFTADRHFTLDDPRIIDMHYGLPAIDILARPLLTPIRIGAWPVEFRVFFGGMAEEDGAVSFYYPQAGEFEVTPELEAAAEQARAWGSAMYTKRRELGLTPWLPPSDPREDIGATVDFMLTEERGLVMIDAGPGFGSGAHPCCYIDVPVEGIRWKLADGIAAR